MFRTRLCILCVIYLNSLFQISSESSEAQAKANETLDSVKALNERLLTLNTEFTKNKLSAEDIQKEVDSISADSNRTLEAVRWPFWAFLPDCFWNPYAIR